MSENVTEAPGVTGHSLRARSGQAPVDSPRDPAGKVSAASQPLGSESLPEIGKGFA